MLLEHRNVLPLDGISTLAEYLLVVVMGTGFLGGPGASVGTATIWLKGVAVPLCGLLAIDDSVGAREASVALLCRTPHETWLWIVFGGIAPSHIASR